MWEFEPGFAFNKPSDVVRVHDAVAKAQLRPACTTPATARWSASSARGRKAPRKSSPIRWSSSAALDGRINHIHLIDSDDSCHKDATGADETTAHPPFGLGIARLRCHPARTHQSQPSAARLVDHRPLLLARCLGGDGNLQEACKRTRGEVRHERSESRTHRLRLHGPHTFQCHIAA